MTSIDAFHPAIQTTILAFSEPGSLQSLGDRLGISKEAVRKRVNLGIAHLRRYGQTLVAPAELDNALKIIDQQKVLIAQLRRHILLHASVIFLLKATLEKITKCFPTFKLSRLTCLEKKYCLDMLEKFLKAGGLIKDFCKTIKKSSETLSAWKKAYEAHGLNGLVDKVSRPKNFGNKVPSWVRDQLLGLFLRFPNWSEYQYHNHIRYNPTTQWYVSLPTIKKLIDLHRQKSSAEKERIKKRWAFAVGTRVWTVDFTVILKTGSYKLQLLTVSDARSRFQFESALFLETSTDRVMDHLAELFIRYGKPDIIKVDSGPEFRMECRERLRDLAVYLLNSPIYYGQFNGAHERIHRMLKQFISSFEQHRNLTRLVQEIAAFEQQHNHDWRSDYLEGKTPFEVLNAEEDFVPKNAEIVMPYKKDGQLTMKFTNREGQPATMELPLIET